MQTQDQKTNYKVNETAQIHRVHWRPSTYTCSSSEIVIDFEIGRKNIEHYQNGR